MSRSVQLTLALVLALACLALWLIKEPTVGDDQVWADLSRKGSSSGPVDQDDGPSLVDGPGAAPRLRLEATIENDVEEEAAPPEPEPKSEPVYVTHLDRALAFARDQPQNTAAKQAQAYIPLAYGSVTTLLRARGEVVFVAEGLRDSAAPPPGCRVVYSGTDKFIIDESEFPEIVDLEEVTKGLGQRFTGEDASTFGSAMHESLLREVLDRYEEARAAAELIR